MTVIRMCFTARRSASEKAPTSAVAPARIGIRYNWKVRARLRTCANQKGGGAVQADDPTQVTLERVESFRPRLGLPSHVGRFLGVQLARASPSS